MQVSEEGTHAGAAAGAILVMRSGGLPPPEVPVFHADRPFVYAIVREQKDVVFLGQLG